MSRLDPRLQESGRAGMKCWKKRYAKSWADKYLLEISKKWQNRSVCASGPVANTRRSPTASCFITSLMRKGFQSQYPSPRGRSNTDLCIAYRTDCSSIGPIDIRMGRLALLALMVGSEGLEPSTSCL